MIPNFIITFGETMEAVLIVGVVLSYLSRTGQAARTTEARTAEALNF